MEKKQYVRPAALVIGLAAEGPLLTASGPVISIGEGETDASESYSAGRGGWNSDDWSSADD